MFKRRTIVTALCPPDSFSIGQFDLRQLPTAAFRGRCVVVDSLAADNSTADALLSDALLTNNENSPVLLGFDSESRPSLCRHQRNATAIIQVASANVCGIWSLKRLGGLPPLLLQLLRNPNIIKVAQGAEYEMAHLQKEFGISLSGFIDLHHIALSLRCTPRSLQALVGIFLHQRLEKTEQLSDWDAEILSQDQIMYAATDAWVCRATLLAMRRKFGVAELSCERRLSSSTAFGSSEAPRLTAAKREEETAEQEEGGAQGGEEEEDAQGGEEEETKGASEKSGGVTRQGRQEVEARGRESLSSKDTWNVENELERKSNNVQKQNTRRTTNPSNTASSPLSYTLIASRFVKASEQKSSKLILNADQIQRVNQWIGADASVSGDKLIRKGTEVLAQACVRRGYKLEASSFDSVVGGFKCGFVVSGRDVCVHAKSTAVYSSIRQAQTDAAIQVMLALAATHREKQSGLPPPQSAAFTTTTTNSQSVSTRTLSREGCFTVRTIPQSNTAITTYKQDETKTAEDTLCDPNGRRYLSSLPLRKRYLSLSQSFQLTRNVNRAPAVSGRQQSSVKRSESKRSYAFL